MIPAISQVCALGSPFVDDLADFKASGFDHLECWVTKLEHFSASNPHQSVRSLLDEHQMAMPVASYQGGLLAAESSQDAAWELFRRRLPILKLAGCTTLVLVADLPHPIAPGDVERAMENLAASARDAADAGMRLALEFHARASFLSNLQTAAAVVDEIGHPALGICLDTFHFQVGPSKLDDLELLDNENLFHVQLADVADRPREFAADGDRILPADGDIAWGPIMNRLKAISYKGLISLEIMNARFAQISARQMAEVGRLAIERILD